MHDVHNGGDLSLTQKKAAGDCRANHEELTFIIRLGHLVINERVVCFGLSEFQTG